MPAQFMDDNGREFQGCFRPDFARIKVATTGASVTELDISALNIAANRGENSNLVLRVAVISNSCYFSVGAASTAPSDNTTMLLLPSGSVNYFRLRSTDVSVYHQQITGAGTLQVAAIV